MPDVYALCGENPFRDFFADFVDLLITQNFAKKTLENYTRYVGRFLDWVYIEKHVVDLDDILWKDFREYQKMLLNTENLKGNTVNQHFSAIKKFYEGVFDKRWNSTAVGNVKFSIFRGATPVQEEVNIILRSIISINDWLMIAIMAYCGLRKEELVCLRFKDIHRERGTLYVAPSKNHEDREVPISPVILDQLARYCHSLPVMPSKEDFIFPGMKDGHHISAETVSNRLDKILSKLGWEDRHYTPHSFRRFFGCSQYLAHPDDLPRLQALMGHRSLSSTMVYIKLAAAFKAMQEDNDRVDNLLRGVVPGCSNR